MRLTQFGLILLTLVSCSSGQKMSSDSVAVPPDFQVTLGEGGGFTGQWDGYAVSPSGSVDHLTGRSLGETKASAGQLSADQVRTLWSLIESSSVADLPEISNAGNMTRSLSITANGKSVKNTWPVPYPAASTLDSVYTAVHSFIQNAVGTN